MFTHLFLAHPRSVDENYGEHAIFALRFAGLLFCAAVAALMHAVIPCLFEKTASGIITKLYQRMHSRG